MRKKTLSSGTLHLVQRQHEVLLCRYVLQHDRQFSFILHCGVHTALHLHKPHSQTTQNLGLACICITLKKQTTCICADAGSYLWLQCVPLLYLGIKLPVVKRQLHLSQEAVVSKAVMVPHGDLQGSCLQLRVADHVLSNEREKWAQRLKLPCPVELKYGA